jgi:hypothetical protein
LARIYGNWNFGHRMASFGLAGILTLCQTTCRTNVDKFVSTATALYSFIRGHSCPQPCVNVKARLQAESLL